MCTAGVEIASSIPQIQVVVARSPTVVLHGFASWSTISGRVIGRGVWSGERSKHSPLRLAAAEIGQKKKVTHDLAYLESAMS